MRISELKKYFSNLVVFDDSSFGPSDLTRSNQSFSPKSVFFAIRGNSFDGHSAVAEAVAIKVKLVFIEDEAYLDQLKEAKINYCVLHSSRQAFEQVMNLVYQSPTADLYCVGITGTNGKTTTNYCIESLLTDMAMPTAIMGTIDHHLGNYVWPTDLTSPGPEEFYPRVLEMKAKGAKALSIELSSHALDQYRMNSIQLDAAIFTNFSQDHLDYHQCMEEYFSAKEKIVNALLADSKKSNKALIYNGDDPWIEKLKLPEEVSNYSVGFKQSSCVRVQSTSSNLEGLKFEVFFEGKEQSFESELVGDFNLYNLGFVIALGLHNKLSLSDLAESVQKIRGVKGRLEKVAVKKQGVHCFVDFAHTPEALTSSLSFLKRLNEEQAVPGRLICVFGAGGDRDKLKRPLMAVAVEPLCDFVVLTSDNPRTETPEQIIEDVTKGFSKSFLSKVNTELSREKAIHIAIGIAEKNDIIVVAGKGHEQFQEIAGVKKQFSDHQQIRSYQE